MRLRGSFRSFSEPGTVNKVYDEFIRLAGIKEAGTQEVKQAAASRQNVAKQAIKTLGDIFVPIIPAIVASGLLMGVLEGLCNVWPDMANSGTYTVIHLFSNAAFVFLPILIAHQCSEDLWRQHLSGGGDRYDHDPFRTDQCLERGGYERSRNSKGIGMVWTV